MSRPPMPVAEREFGVAWGLHLKVSAQTIPLWEFVQRERLLRFIPLCLQFLEARFYAPAAVRVGTDKLIVFAPTRRGFVVLQTHCCVNERHIGGLFDLDPSIEVFLAIGNRLGCLNANGGAVLSAAKYKRGPVVDTFICANDL